MNKPFVILCCICVAVVSLAAYYSPIFMYGMISLIVVTILFNWILKSRERLSDHQTYMSDNYTTRELNVESVREARIGNDGREMLIIHHLSQIQSISQGNLTMQKAIAAQAQEIVHPMLGEPRPQLMEATSNCHCVLFVGARGRGKTTNMKRMMESRNNREVAVVIDTHSSISKWPHATEIVGSEIGLERRERLMGIWNKLQALVNLMDERLDDMRQGLTPEGQFPDLCIYIDEFTHLPNAFKDEMDLNIKNLTGRILTEGRKVNINFIWGSHSATAESVGLQGSYKGLKECFDAIIYLHHSKKSGDFYATIDWSGEEEKDKVQYELARPYDDGSVVTANDIGSQTVIIDLGAYEGPEEAPQELEIDEKTGWPIIREGKEKERIQKFGTYMVEMGFNLSELKPGAVLDFLELNRNGRCFRYWSQFVNQD